MIWENNKYKIINFPIQTKEKIQFWVIIELISKTKKLIIKFLRDFGLSNNNVSLINDKGFNLKLELILKEIYLKNIYLNLENKKASNDEYYDFNLKLNSFNKELELMLEKFYLEISIHISINMIINEFNIEKMNLIDNICLNMSLYIDNEVEIYFKNWAFYGLGRKYLLALIKKEIERSKNSIFEITKILIK